MSRYFKKNPNVESYNDMTQKVYTKLMELNTRSYKIVTKDGKDFNNLSPGWKTAILLDLILGYEQDTAPIIIDQPEDNLAVKYINSTLTETIKAVKWSKQVIMVSHNATIPMMADAQTIVVCENDGNKITIRSASLESEVFGQKVLDYIADQTDGGRTSIKLFICSCSSGVIPSPYSHSIGCPSRRAAIILMYENTSCFVLSRITAAISPSSVLLNFSFILIVFFKIILLDSFFN